MSSIAVMAQNATDVATPLLLNVGHGPIIVYFPGTYGDGIVVEAQASGTYRFTILEGAYAQFRPPAVTSDADLTSGWLAGIMFYKNRPVEYRAVEGSVYSIKRVPVNPDYTLGETWPPRQTYIEAATYNNGKYVDIPLEKGDRLMLVLHDAVGDNKDYFKDDLGGMNIKISSSGEGQYSGEIIYPSSPQKVFLSSKDAKGVTFIANESGTYSFSVLTGAYRRNDTLGNSTVKWSTEIAIFKDRPAGYEADGMLQGDYSLGNAELFDTYVSAYDAASGKAIQVALQKNDTLTFVCVDSAGAYLDNSGGFSINSNYPGIPIRPEDLIVPVAAVSTGAGISVFAVFFEKVISSFIGGGKSYAQRWASVKEVKTLGIMANIFKKPLLFKVSLLEALVAVFSIILLGVTFAYVNDGRHFILLNIAVFSIIAGMTTVIHELAHWYYATRYGTRTELRFWGIGTLALLVTTLLFGVVFGQPARTIINSPEKLEKKKMGIISMAGPLVSLSISAVFLMVMAFGGSFSYIGVKGLPISMVACVYSLLPIYPMEGKNVWNWDRKAWAFAFLPALIAYMALLVYYSAYLS
jgi:hypothetical protein